MLEPTSGRVTHTQDLAISSDGRKCLSCYGGNDAGWWGLSLPPTQQATEVSGLDGYAEYVAMSHDGMRLVLGSGCEVQVCDAVSEDSRQLGGVPDAVELDSEGIGRMGISGVSCLDITGDGKYAAAGGRQHTTAASGSQPTRAWLCVWDLEEGRPAPLAVTNLPEGQAPRALSVSSDGHWVTAITDRDEAWRWEVGSKVLEIPVALDHAGFIGQSSIPSDGHTAVACKSRQVQVWDLTTGTLEGHTEHVHTAGNSADGWRAVSGGDDCLFKVWDLEFRTCLATLQGHKTAVLQAALSADGKHVVSATFTGVMRVWQLSV